MIRIDYKPLSVNQAYTGKRYNTKEHRQFVKDVSYLLPKINLPEPPYEIYFKFGLSSILGDWDNSVKVVQDTIAKKYKINDKSIRKCTGVDIEIVPVGKEYFEFELNTLGTKVNIFDRHKEAGFDCLFPFNDINDTKWCCGFFCQGAESAGNDGLICYLPLQNKPESVRNKYLSKLFKTPEEAISDTYEKYIKSKYNEQSET